MNQNEDAKVAQLGKLVSTQLLGLNSSDRLLLVIDNSGWHENGDIAQSIMAEARALGAETITTLVDDAPVNEAGQRIEYLPESVGAAMEHSTAVVSLTRTTSAPLPHHHTPLRLLRENRIRGVFMVKRSRDDLLGDSVLGVDYEFMTRVTKAWSSILGQGNEVQITNTAGTNLTASIEGMPSRFSQFAHSPGTMSPINWGEVYQGPRVGSANGVLVVDGPILGYGWPADPVRISIESGLAVSMEGPSSIVNPLWTLVQEVENGCNVAEIALGINPRANNRDSTNVYKKGLARVHVALGNGLVYDQGVDSDIHIDFVLPTPTLSVDGEEIVHAGEPVDPSLSVVRAEAGGDR